MSPIQQMLLGVGAVATKTYVDDIFSTFVYKGTGGANTVNTGLDISGEGGLVWVKNRTYARNSMLFDTVRGVNQEIATQSTSAQNNNTGLNQTFTSTGFTFNTSNSDVNSSSYDYASWTFRKSPMFDVVTYTGNGSARTIAHSLGSVPGMIMVKRTDGADNWVVYHRGNADANNAGHYFLRLNTTAAKQDSSSRFNDTEPTASVFSVGTDAGVNANGGTYVAYVFAGGASTAANARSVSFDAATESLYATSSDYAFGTGDFTIEAWIKPSNLSGVSYQNILDTRGSVGNSTTGFSFGVTSNGELYVYTNGFDLASATNTIVDNRWYHIALVNNGGTIKAYVNGVEKGSFSNSKNFTNTTFRIAMTDSGDGAQNFLGLVSNVRVVKGTAVYTSSFRPPAKVLTNITNTKLLCCNNSSTTGSTVASGTLTADGSPTASSDSPFDDPAGFVFGENEDQNVIKTGSYEGNNADDGTEVYLGWEPSFLLIKSADTADNWCIFDNLRGMTVDGVNDQVLFPNASDAESAGNYLTPTSTGFKLTTQSDRVNNNSAYIFLALRRPDGYVGKPPELGTGAFAMDTGNTQTTIPNYDSGFPVDFALLKNTGSSTSWDVTARLTGTKYLKTDSTTAEANFNDYTFDSNTGWAKDNGPGTMQSWMWKRGQGFDCISYKGDGSSPRQLAHSMNNTVEMIWTKNRDSTAGWRIWHKDLNGGGSNAAKYYLDFETNSPTSNGDIYGGQAGTLPSSTHYTVGGNNSINENGSNFLALLFSSVLGISKVGSYTGNGSASGQTITLGFQPRFLILKTHNNYFWVLDTTRGWASGNDKWLALDLAAGQGNTLDWGAPTSTGFTVPNDNGIWNANGDPYYYYAHA